MNQYEENKTRLVRLLTTLGNTQMEQGKYAEAVQHYEKILALEIEEPAVFSALSQAYIHLNRFDTKALNIYRKTLHFEPENQAVCQALCQHYLSINRRDREAIQLFTRALQLKSTLTKELLPLLIQLQLEQKELPQAIASAQQAIELPELQDEALTYYLQLVLHGKDFVNARDFLKNQYLRTRHLPFLIALNKVVIEEQAQTAEKGQMLELPEEIGELGCELLKAKPALQQFDDLLLLSVLVEIIEHTRCQIQNHLKENNIDFKFFFQNLNPTQVIKHGFTSNSVLNPDELNFFQLIWERLPAQIAAAAPANPNKSTGRRLHHHRFCLALAFQILNFRSLFSRHGLAKTQTLIQNLLLAVTPTLTAEKKWQLRFLADGLLGLALNQETTLQEVIQLLRAVEQYQLKLPAPEQCEVAVSLTLFEPGLMDQLEFYKAIAQVIQLNEMARGDKTGTTPPNTATTSREARLIISARLYGQIQNSAQYVTQSMGSQRLRYAPVPQLLYSLDWIDPLARLKAGVLKKLGRFEIMRNLDDTEGYSVYQGRDNLLERLVIMKAIRESQPTNGTQVAALTAKFLEEARKMAPLNHRHIVMIYDVGREGGFSYLAREYFEGQDLKTYYQSITPADWKRLIRIVLQVCSALKYVHQMGIVHGNLKPNNIIVAPNEDVKLTDFGSVNFQLKAALNSQHIRKNIVYLAPEQLSGQTLDFRGDIHAVGVILYEMLTGQTPFAGNDVALIRRHLLELAPPLPSSLNPQVPPALDGIIQKALAKNPDERYPNILRMGQELSALAGSKALTP